MGYRPHIDGLRAIAVLFVLLFHAGLTLFPSGFIGVDIFFVISGFLITGIIHNSLQKNDFSFIQFYNRRLWRLQPVFICLILVSTIFTLIFYVPEDLLDFSKSARKTTLFLSNQYFERATNGYFADNINQLPLLHTWSLSIEWQCYLILPVTIYLLERFLGEKNIAKVSYILTLGFFALALYFSSVVPAKTYYLFSSRIFEFLIGASLALTPQRFVFNRYLLSICGLAAFVSLFYVAMLPSISVGFPNWYALMICLATAVLIRAGEQETTPFCIRLLSLKPVVFIGLLSYSLYIWHWPVFVLIRYLSIEETRAVIVIAFCLVAIFAYLSWRYIEKPSRKLSNTKFSHSLTILLILPLIVFHLSDYGVKKFDGYPQRSPESIGIFTLLEKHSSKIRPQCIFYNPPQLNANCVLGAKNATSLKGFMIGDSFSNHSWRFMDLIAKNANLSVLAYSTATCLSLPGILQYDWGALHANDVYHFCSEQNKLHYKMIKENHYDFVILGEAWPSYLNERIITKKDDPRSLELAKEHISKALDVALELITSSGARPVILKSTALPPTNVRNCFFKHIVRRISYKPGECDFNLDPQQAEWFDELFAKMKKKYAHLIIIDPKKILCPKGKCKADINGLPVYRDQVHITDYASYFMGKSYLKRYKNPLVG
ncbi:MAG: acyltransferase [Tatlockia sp.]|nr:acyltransferase [Tatlockia sp.]